MMHKTVDITLGTLLVILKYAIILFGAMIIFRRASKRNNVMNNIPSDLPFNQTPNGGNISRRDYLAGQAMLVVLSETQETVPASFWDLIKSLLHGIGFTFLQVRYKTIEGVYEQGAKKAVEYADMVLKELDREKTYDKEQSTD